MLNSNKLLQEDVGRRIYLHAMCLKLPQLFHLTSMPETENWQVGRWVTAYRCRDDWK